MTRAGMYGRVGQVLPPSRRNSEPSSAKPIPQGNESPTMTGPTSYPSGAMTSAGSTTGRAVVGSLRRASREARLAVTGMFDPHRLADQSGMVLESIPLAGRAWLLVDCEGSAPRREPLGSRSWACKSVADARITEDSFISER